MPSITRLTLRRRRWGQVFEVEIDGAPWAEIDDEVAAREGIRRGLSLDEAGLERLLAASRRREAERRATAWLSGRVRTGRQVSTYLRRARFPAEIAEGVAAWCRERGLVDEQRYAEALTRRRRREGRVGPRKVEAELRAAGVGSTARESSAAGLGDAAEQRAACVRLLGRRSAFRLPVADAFVARRKARDFLLRRGFPLGVVRAALEAHFAGAPAGGDAEDEGDTAPWFEGDDGAS